MAGSFQVGSITASLELDSSPFLKGLKQIAATAKQAAGKVKKALRPAEEIRIDTAAFQRGFATLTNRAKQFAQKFARVVSPIKTALSGTIVKAAKISKATFIGLGTIATATAKKIGKSFSGLSRIFASLKKRVLGLQGMLAALGTAFTALALVNKAREVSSIREAFESLTASVGTTADVMLEKLRKATRGTVSDLELMRTTNNAVLLGVVKGADDFAELADVARKLGKAVGRDAVDALNDLSIGIGRQSRLILDNLGIIVRVGEAQKKYAALLGTTADKLTLAQQRQAFYNATIEAARKKAKELGKDSEGIVETWGRFTAQISNTVAVLAEAFVGRGSIFGKIGEALEKNQDRIAAYAKAVARGVEAAISSLGEIFKPLLKAENMRDFFKALANIVVDGITGLMTLALRTILIGVGSILNSALPSIGELIAVFVSIIGMKLTASLSDMLDKVALWLIKQVGTLLSKIPGVAKMVGLESEKELQNFYQAIEKAKQEQLKISEREAKKRLEVINSLIDMANQDLAESLQDVGKDVKRAFDFQDFTNSSNSFLRAVGKGIAALDRAFIKLKTDMADPFARFSTLKVRVELNLFAKAFNDIIKIRKRLISEAPELITREQLQESGRRLKEFQQQISDLSEAFVQLKQAPKAAREEATKKFVEAFKKTKSSLDENIAAITKFADTVKSKMGEVVKIGDITVQFDPEQIQNIDQAVSALQDSMVGAAKVTKSARPEFEEITKTLDDLLNSAKRIPKMGDYIKEALQPTYMDLEKFNKLISPFTESGEKIKALQLEIKTIGVSEAEKELAKFDQIFNEIRKDLSPDQMTQVDAARKRLADLLRQRENAKQMEEAKKALEQFQKQLEQLQDVVDRSRIGELSVKFRELDRAMREALSKAPAEMADQIREKFDRMAEALAAAEVAKASEQLRQLRAELEGVNQTTAERKIEALTREFNQFREALISATGVAIPKANQLLEEFSSTITKLQQATVEKDFADAMQALRTETERFKREFETLGLTDSERDFREVELTLEEMRASLDQTTESLLRNAEAAGASGEELGKLAQKITELKNQFEGQALELKAQVKMTGDKRELLRVTGELAGSIERNLGGAIMEAFRRGESISKQWSRVAAGFFEDAMNKAFDRLTNALQKAMSSIFSNAGLGAAAGGLLQGLLGVAGLLYTTMKGGAQTAIEDFSQSINSSEAVRGVVAGPTNVAISKIGDSLKEALRTTEILLERIAVAVERNSPATGTGGGDLSGNAVLPLSTSTIG